MDLVTAVVTPAVSLSMEWIVLGLDKNFVSGFTTARFGVQGVAGWVLLIKKPSMYWHEGLNRHS